VGRVREFLGVKRQLKIATTSLLASALVGAFIFVAPARSTEPAAANASPGIGGYWHIEGRLAGNAVRLLCHFNQAGADLSGLCFGDGTQATGNFDSGRAVWRWKVGSHVLTFDGSLGADGVLKGKVSTVAFAGIPVAGNFSAARPVAESESDPAEGKTALKLIIGGLARGEIPGETCTAEFADGLRKQLPTLQAAYALLGTVKSMSFVDRIHGSPRVTTEIYEVHFPSAKRICSIDVNKAGKLSDLICAGE